MSRGWPKARPWVVGLGMLLLLVGYIGFDLSRLQPGMESPTAVLQTTANQTVRNQPDFFAAPAIQSYPSLVLETADGIELTVYTAENDRPASILLVHGAGGGAWVWEPYLAALSTQYNVYAFSWRGHFDSEDVPDANSDDYARDTAVVLDYIYTETGAPVHLIGHSWGGAVAVKTAVLAPEQVASLLLLAPVVPLDYTPVQQLIVPTLIRGAVRSALENGRTGGSFADMFVATDQMTRYLEIHASQPYSVEKPGLLADDGFLPARQAALAEEYLALAALDIPVRVMLARYDNVIAPDRLREWAERIEAPLVELDSGHYLPLDYLAPESVRQIELWLMTVE